MKTRILVTAASGFIGNAVTSYFKKQGYDVYRLVRHAHQKAPDTVFWNPINEEIYLDDLEGFSCGHSLGGKEGGMLKQLLPVFKWGLGAQGRSPAAYSLSRLCNFL